MMRYICYSSTTSIPESTMIMRFSVLYRHSVYYPLYLSAQLVSQWAKRKYHYWLLVNCYQMKLLIKWILIYINSLVGVSIMPMKESTKLVNMLRTAKGRKRMILPLGRGSREWDRWRELFLPTPASFTQGVFLSEVTVRVSAQFLG